MSTKVFYSFILLFFSGSLLLWGQSRPISGKITDADGAELAGVTVVVKGTRNGTSSGADGRYTINAETGNTLVFTFTGFTALEKTVEAGNTLDAQMAEDNTTLSEYVVVGYGVQKKSQTTGAISSIRAREIAELPITDPRQALQGRAAGVDVVQRGSRPGSGPTVRIRGRRSINASNEPLFVIDGIPIEGSIDDFNPQDIESMEVLKDASATAIYGARGSNGVVLVTTKRGKQGKTVVSFDTYVGTQQSLGKIELFDGPEFAEYKRESRRTVGRYPAGVDATADKALFEAVELSGIAEGRTTDYVGALLRDGLIQNHQVGVYGGNDRTKFAFSGNYFKDIGVIKNQDFTRFSFRINLDHQITKNFMIGASSLGVRAVRNGEFFNPLGVAFRENPLGIPYDKDGNLIFLPTPDGLQTNPIAEVVKGAQVDESIRHRIFNSLYAVWTIIPGLTYRANFGPDFQVARAGRFTGSQTQARRGGDPTGSVGNAFRFNWTIENILNYQKSIRETHNFNITALYAVQEDNLEASSISVQGLPAEGQSFYALGNAQTITGINTDLSERTLQSYMGRVNYDFKEKYLLTLTMRADGSSAFGANTKFGYFPSASVAWNATNERFLQKIKWLDLLKLRVSYGAIGNQAITPYQTQGLLSRTVYAWDNSPAFGYRPNSIGNPDLSWETSTTGNIGIDFSLFRGRISGSLELYNTLTTDLLLRRQLPASIGFGSVLENVGKTRNRGVELALTTINVDRGQFKWTTDLQFFRNTERIVELFNGRTDDIGNNLFIDKPLTAFFDFKKIGIWQTNEAEEAKKYQGVPGEIKVQDTNGDGAITSADRVILGSQVPDFSAGLTNRFSYKGLDLSFFLFARVGQMLRSRYHDSNNTLFGRYNNIKVDYWTPNNPTNEFPRPNQDQEFPKNNSSMTYFDASFLKLRNVNIGYTLPGRASRKIGFESFRVYVSAQQPFIFAEYRSKYNGIDPETDDTVDADVVPATRILMFGINAQL